LIDRDQQALDAAARVGARRSAQIQALNGLGYVYGLINQYDQARAINRRAMALASESPRLLDRADALYQAGQIGYHMNSYDEALACLNQAYSLYEAIDAQHGQARCLELLAWIWRRQAGVTDQVVGNLQQALSIYRALGDDYRERHCRVSLANVYLLRGAFEEVLGECAAVLPFFRATHARYTIAECQYLRGVALYAIGRLPEALEALDETVVICQELGITAAVEVNRLYRGQVLRALERYDEGLRDLEAACATNDRLVKPRALIALAEFWLDRHELPLAFKSVAQALALVREIGSQPYLGIALRLLGQVRAADSAGALPAPSSLLPHAQACFQSSIELLKNAQYDSDLALTYARYGAYLLGRGCGA
jgi:tetratricopeptide (TPR) repeat protein